MLYPKVLNNLWGISISAMSSYAPYKWIKLKYIYQGGEERTFQVPKYKAIAQVKTMSRISIEIKRELEGLLGRIHSHSYNTLKRLTILN